MGNSGDTPDAQSSPKKDVDSVGSTDGVVDAPQSVPSRFEESQVNIVTRAGDWMTTLAEETSNCRDLEVASPAPL